MAPRTPANKARALVATLRALPGDDYVFTLDDVVFTVRDPHFDGSALVVTVEATKHGVPLPVDNPYRFVNPPVHVRTRNPDETYSVVHDQTLAVRRIIRDAVFTVARRRGWTG